MSEVGNTVIARGIPRENMTAGEFTAWAMGQLAPFRENLKDEYADKIRDNIERIAGLWGTGEKNKATMEFTKYYEQTNTAAEINRAFHEIEKDAQQKGIISHIAKLLGITEEKTVPPLLEQGGLGNAALQEAGSALDVLDAALKKLKIDIPLDGIRKQFDKLATLEIPDTIRDLVPPGIFGGLVRGGDDAPTLRQVDTVHRTR